MLLEGIPSLALNLAVLLSGNHSRAIQRKALAQLGLSDMPISNLDELLLYASKHKGDFPGAEAFQLIAQLEVEKLKYGSLTGTVS